MPIIYETQNFIVEAPEKPHINRDDGGHIKIYPKKRIINRQGLLPHEAIELMRLTMIAGEAMTKIMNEHGVDIGRINYQDNGNWSVLKPEGAYLHIHLYGRAKSAKVHKYGQACWFPHMDDNPEYYKDFKPLTAKDIKDIKKEIAKLFIEDKYLDKNWF